MKGPLYKKVYIQIEHGVSRDHGLVAHIRGTGFFHALILDDWTCPLNLWDSILDEDQTASEREVFRNCLIVSTYSIRNIAR